MYRVTVLVFIVLWNASYSTSDTSLIPKNDNYEQVSAIRVTNGEIAKFKTDAATKIQVLLQSLTALEATENAKIQKLSETIRHLKGVVKDCSYLINITELNRCI